MEYRTVECSEAKINVNSYWQCASDGNGGWRISRSPSTGSTTVVFNYALPVGAIIQELKLYADQSGGLGGGTEWANGVELEQEGANADTHSATLNPANATGSSFQVVLSHRSGGVAKGPAGQHHSSKVFTNVRIVIGYILPGSSWALNQNGSYKPGDSMRITITPVNASFTHSIDVVFETVSLYSGDVSSNGSSGTQSWSFELGYNLLKYIPKSISGKGTVTLCTYSNDKLQLAEETKEFTLTANGDDINVRPSIESLTVHINNGSNGRYICELSTGTAIAGTMTGKYNATIISNLITVYRGSSTSGEAVFSGESPLDIGRIYDPGEYTVVLLVVDSRGCTTTKTTSFQAIDKPAITVERIIAERCLADGTISSSGICACVRVKFSIAGESSPTCEAKFQIREKGSLSWVSYSQTGYPSDTNFIFPNYRLESNVSYEVKVTLTDSYGQTTSSTTYINTSYVFMRWEPNNNAFGFGCYPEESERGRIQISGDWDLVHGSVSIYEILMPLGSVLLLAGDVNPNTSIGGSWTEVGSLTIGTASVKAWEKTGAVILSL